jgi:uncharacterized iron-regulated protein
MRLHAVLLVLLVSAACAHAPRPVPTKPETGQLSTDAKASLSEDDFLELAKGAQFVLIGEAHDNACDHQQQARLIGLLASRGQIGVVGFEMLSVDQQPAVDVVNEGKLAPGEMGGVLDWNRRWGVPFELYQPIFEAIRKGELKVAALNAPKTVVHKVRDAGFDHLSSEERKDITPTLIPPVPEQEAMLREAMSAHSHHSTSTGVSEQAWERFVRVQSFWDSQMAYAAVRNSQVFEKNIALIAGAGHVQHGWGIAHRLRQFAPGARTLSVLPRRPGETPEPGEADVYFLCPPVETPTVTFAR